MLRSHLKDIFTAALSAVDGREAVKRTLSLQGDMLNVGPQSYDLTQFKNIYIIGAGKATHAMALGMEELLGERITGGIINVRRGGTLPLKRVQVNEAGHPIPDEAGVRGTEEILGLVSGLREGDLAICLLSGGGSALLVAPVEGVSLADKRLTTQLLLKSGATIREVNAVRKHISRVKGGQLAKAVHPATLITLLISDVVGDHLDVIASGPTVPDPTTFADALGVIERYGLGGSLPRSVISHLKAGLRGEVEETPKVFEAGRVEIIASNLTAVLAARKRAEELGYQTLILSCKVEGEAREVARFHASIAKEVLSSGNPLPPPACLISGGETTVTVKGRGTGGRNQELALAAAIELSGVEGIALLAAGTDGSDGMTEAAGAFADGRTVTRALSLGLEPKRYLDDNNSHPFFQALGDLFITGPTNTNVMDLTLILVGSVDTP